MIIYTHDDVIQMMDKFHTSILNRDLCMAKLTPIELTEISDKEILIKAVEHSKLYTNKFVPRNAFIQGAKWYREQLKQRK